MSIVQKFLALLSSIIGRSSTDNVLVEAPVLLPVIVKTFCPPALTLDKTVTASVEPAATPEKPRRNPVVNIIVRNDYRAKFRSRAGQMLSARIVGSDGDQVFLSRKNGPVFSRTR